ncbi:MAG: amidinotransferase [Candidatus Saccharibacteria bacterium]|nr:amidinotransferase [Candidatus Saccharibacteria bacterium]
MSPKINKTVLMSGADYFTDDDAINALMDANIPVNVEAAKAEHALIRQSLEAAGVSVVKVDAPLDCQDGVYTANWALVRHGVAVMARLPNKRKPEEVSALQAVKDQGLEPMILPNDVERFSGQGDALACGDILFTQSPYRTTTSAHPYLKKWLGFREVIALQTKPERRWHGLGPAKINKITGWPDSPTYDVDLAIAVLKWPSDGQKGLIAWCPSVFKPTSRKVMQSFDEVDKIEVSHAEAMKAYALNLVSTGETVIMNAGAPKFQAALEAHGLKIVALNLPELRKGGGSIRCSTLTLDN